MSTDRTVVDARTPLAAFPGGVTVLMCVYRGDSPHLFEAALSSIYEGERLPDAFQLVVDGPLPADLEEVIERYAARDSFFTLRLPDNVGLAKALNAGLGQVKTAWVARADADDINEPGRLRLQGAAAASNPQLALIGGNIVEVDARLRPTGYRIVPSTQQEIAEFIRWRSPFNHMTVVFRTDVVAAVGGYPEIHLKEDYALWASLLARGAQSTNLQAVLVRATAGSDMHKRRGGWRYAKAEAQLQLHLVRCGVKPVAQGLIHCALRAAAFLLPSALRGWLYQTSLRQKTGAGGR